MNEDNHINSTIIETDKETDCSSYEYNYKNNPTNYKSNKVF